MFFEGSQIGPYTLIRILGRGGFGEVWLAENRTKFATTQVAVKLPLDEQVEHALIEQEAQLWAKASGHPNVLPIIEANEYDGQVVIVSEYSPDGSLEDFLKRNGGRLEAEQAVEMTIGILKGLGFLHSKQIIHRDLKPDNIILQGDIPRLADFGISRVVKSSLATNASGTPYYMSPEAFKRERTAQTDIWSIGVILYKMLKGELPFFGNEIAEVFCSITEDEPNPLPDNVPVLLQKIVWKALSKDPAKRYQTVDEMQRELRSFLVINSHPFFPAAEPLSVLEELEKLELEGVKETNPKEIGSTNLKGLEVDETNPEDPEPTNPFVNFPSSPNVGERTSVVHKPIAGPAVTLPLPAQLNPNQPQIKRNPNQQPYPKRRTTPLSAKRKTKWLYFAVPLGVFLLLVIGGGIYLFSRSNNQKLSSEYFTRASECVDRKDYECAIENFGKSIKLNPDYAPAYTGRGWAYIEKDKYDQAVDDCDKAIKLSPDSAEAYNCRGWAGYYKADLTGSFKNCDKAVELKSDYAEAYVCRGLVYIKKENYTSAFNDCDKAARLKPEYSRAYSCRATIYLDRDHSFDQAIGEYTKAIELSPDYARGYANRGLAYSQQKKYDQAIRDFDEAIKLKPDYAEVYNLRSGIYITLKNYEQALDGCDKAVKIKGDAHSYNCRADVYFYLKAYDQAILDYNNLLLIDPDNANGYFNRGNSYFNLKKYDLAIENYQKAVAVDPTNKTYKASLEQALKMKK